MNRIALSLAVALACAWPTCATVAARSTTPASGVVENVLSMPVDGDIAINADGSVRSYTVSTKVTPGLEAMLQDMVPKWRFELKPVDGVVKPVEARMRISLAATQTDKGYQVRIENVTFPRGAGTKEVHAARTASLTFTPRDMSPPRYPRELERAGVTGKVLLGLYVDPDGHMREVVPVQVMLYNVRARDRTMGKLIELMEDNAVQAARGWTVMVTADGAMPTSPKEFTTYTTVEYVLTRGHITPDPMDERDAKAAGKWVLVSRTPKRPMPWVSGIEGLQEVGVADVQSGEMVPLASSIRLKTEVAGTVLTAPAG
jgi:hypothetical protein